MRAILIHAKKFSFVPIKKEISVAELAAKGQKIDLGRCLVLFSAFEEGDNEDKLSSLVSQIKKDSGEVKETKVIIYPFVHLTEKPLEPEKAMALISVLAKNLAQEGLEVHRAPFGWTKSFSIESMPHPLAERGLRV